MLQPRVEGLAEINPESMGWGPDSDVTDFKDPTWYSAASSWLKVTPFGFRRLLKWLSQYNKPIIVTENGFSDFLGNLDDLQRVYYYKHYINQMLKGKKKSFFREIGNYQLFDTKILLLCR